MGLLDFIQQNNSFRVVVELAAQCSTFSITLDIGIGISNADNRNMALTYNVASRSA